MTAQPRVVSLREMLQLDARPFLDAVTQLRSMQVLINNIAEKDQVCGDQDTPIIRSHLNKVGDALTQVGARLALRSVDRLQGSIMDDAHKITYQSVLTVLADIELRFADHLDDVILFVVPEVNVRFFNAENDFIDDNIAFNFPSAVFEFDEAGKCIALGRFTASVFHLMRVLEIGIRAVARYLEIDDPLKPAERNWAIILKAINEKMQSKWPMPASMNNDKRQAFERIYANLESVRNPWRNSTMHIDRTYAPHEATHIYNVVDFFMKELALHCDEDGLEPL